MNDPHVRFLAWLAAGATGEPPRDLAVHASVCPGCQASIAAYDRLAAVDPGLAAQVPPRRSRDMGGALIGVGRLATALAGVVVAAAVVGLGAAQLVAGMRAAPSNSEVAVATETPQQQVAHGSGTPQPTASSNVIATPEASSPSQLQTAFPTPLPISTFRPIVTPRPTVPPTLTPTPTPVPPTLTPTPTPTPVPTPTDTPTPVPTETPTPVPTETPTPVPTETPAPVPTPVPTP